jgi:hypothetical protein
METSILPSPAVAGVLDEKYVEARLFTDGDENIERILDLQNRLAGTLANPTYVLVDPGAERKLAQLQGKRTASTFKRFLEAGIERAEEKVAAAR